MMIMDILRGLEGKDLQEQVEAVVKLLEDAGFQTLRRASVKGTENVFYFKDDCDAVLCVVSSNKLGYTRYVFIDKVLFDTTFRYNKRTISFNERHDGNQKVLAFGEGYYNAVLHRLAVGGVCSKQAIDHLSHNVWVNLSEFLRVCIAQENNFNKKFYSKVDEESKSFSVPDKIVDVDTRIRYAKNGFRFYKNRIYSPSYDSFEELYNAIDEFENKILKDFRYNPLRDFSKTWFVIVAWKMLGILNEVDVNEYQRDYFRRNDTAVTTYYRL